MATFLWELQGTTDTTIEATDIVQFAGAAGFDAAVTVGEYQDTTHVESSAGANDSSANTPNNVKYVAGSTGNWGDGVEAMNLMLAAEATFKINFSHGTTVVTESAIFYAYDGSTTTAVPTGVTFFAAEQGDAAWTAAEGSAAAVTLTDNTAATSHDFFVAASVSPDSVGAKTAFALRVELIYS